jgi:hypothetical protein
VTRRLLLALWIVAGLAPTPGCGPSTQTRAVRAAFVAADVTRAAFVAHDAPAQQRLIDAATSLADGQQKLATYRAARERMLGLFVAAYRALASAAIDPRAPEVAAALGATQRLAEALRTLFPEAP